MKAYIAGPLFSQAEKSFNLLIRELCLRSGLEPFLPQLDAPTLTADNGEEVFGAELRAIEEADVIVANLDGMDVDSGTAWEIGYAVARGKSIIGIRTDWRSFSPCERVNLMIESCASIFVSLEALENALKAYVQSEDTDEPKSI